MFCCVYSRLGILVCLVSSLCLSLGVQIARGDDAGPAAASTRYGWLGRLDHRSRYGEYWFPEPLRMGETDVDNEIRADWTHLEGKGRVSDDVKAEVEKSFGLTTVELELPYSRESLLVANPATGRTSHERAEGIGNVSIGARHPHYQFVSSGGCVDDTVGAAFEAGIPVNSAVSKNTELVPKIFNDLRLGERLSVQTLVGYAFLLGGGADGGRQTFEYATVFGYSFQREDIHLRGIERVVPLFELLGQTGLNHGDAGRNNLTGTFGFRLNLASIGALQPRLGIGYVFPIDKGARDTFNWGVVTSLVFEF